MWSEPTTTYRNADERRDGIMKDYGRDGNDKKEVPTSGTVRLLDVYEFRQKYGYFSIVFSVVQTLILIAMMLQCGVAPLQINPMVGPYPDALSYWGAKNAVLILEDGEHWRLLSANMLHAGIIHLIGNVSVQVEMGAFFEREWGSGVWLIVYLAGALGSSVLSTCALPGLISVGSSGAVMALFGAKLSEIFCRSCESRLSVQEKVGHAVRMEQLSGTVICIIIVMLFSFIPYVDWAAHVGGLLSGMAIGLTIFSCYTATICWRVIWFVVGFALTVAYFAVTFLYMYNRVTPNEALRDVCGYYQQYFEDYECHCMMEEQNR
jgi:membrane associated rhomboid family serine protease